MSDIPNGVIDRINKEKGKRPGVVKSHILRHPADFFTVQGCLCPLCETPIRGLVEADGMRTIRRSKGQTVIEKPMVLACLASYAEVTIEFDDGSKHVTGICKSCIEEGLTAEDLEAVYAADLLEMATIEQNGGGRAPWKILSDRKPMSFKRTL